MTHATTETILLGGGCFWCMEAVFKGLRGIKAVLPGYAGGHTPHPTYEEVCTNTTGHAEVIEVVFDPAEMPLRDLLAIYFTTHNPTEINRQGNDVGEQYRSVVYGTPQQLAVAEKVRQAIDESNIWGKPVVTALEPRPTFWPAEEQHQDYFARNPDKAYCQAVIAPKVAKARQLYRARYSQDQPS
ncbi:peptide-methionine (S)-S-oxide reductase MsrA [Formicincola oecophyllae]|uniref:Peptide methionine sulfoxide reductase MsrA n=1 Tax=Formicincola oecophyllae TaxID=2558361 RepID=A0A4Y6U7A7_9PROT|nr:peptide-methionine (S)-S-oxide reductase MsrA [Formicincola oecophyllae]QDH13269.1 peptide-methionine (S)-S-oxide reductase MsrA [Formicincola oecophyllae]